MGMSIRDMARALGVGKSQAQRDKADGMPMDSAQAAQAWRAAHRDVSRTVEGRIDRPAAAANLAAPPPPPAAPDEDEPKPDDTVDYRKARTEREQIRRDRERMELDQARGLLIDSREAARLAFTSFRALRDSVLNVPARVAQQLAVETDPMRIEQILAAELAAPLNAVNEARLLTESDADDDPD